MQGETTSITCLILPQIKEISLTQALGTQSQQEFLGSQGDIANSLQILRSNLSIPKALSAFSIYCAEKVQPQSTEQIQRESHVDLHNSLYKTPFSKPNTQLPSLKTKIRDKRQLSRLQTKNMNRFFRSKINQMLRDVKESSSSSYDKLKADEMLHRLNETNKIMFSQMREILKDQWLNHKLTKCSSVLMRYVHKGKMGMSSKLLTLKYFNKMLKAIRKPQNFICWK